VSAPVFRTVSSPLVPAPLCHVKILRRRLFNSYGLERGAQILKAERHARLQCGAALEVLFNLQPANREDPTSSSK